MDAKNLAIIWLSIQLSILSYAVCKLSYQLGYERGRIQVLTTFQGENPNDK